MIIDYWILNARRGAGDRTLPACILAHLAQGIGNPRSAVARPLPLLLGYWMLKLCGRRGALGGARFQRASLRVPRKEWKDPARAWSNRLFQPPLELSKRPRFWRRREQVQFLQVGGISRCFLSQRGSVNQPRVGSQSLPLVHPTTSNEPQRGSVCLATVAGWRSGSS